MSVPLLFAGSLHWIQTLMIFIEHGGNKPGSLNTQKYFEMYTKLVMGVWPRCTQGHYKLPDTFLQKLDVYEINVSIKYKYARCDMVYLKHTFMPLRN